MVHHHIVHPGSNTADEVRSCSASGLGFGVSHRRRSIKVRALSGSSTTSPSNAVRPSLWIDTLLPHCPFSVILRRRIENHLCSPLSVILRGSERKYDDQLKKWYKCLSRHPVAPRCPAASRTRVPICPASGSDGDKQASLCDGNSAYFHERSSRPDLRSTQP